MENIFSHATLCLRLRVCGYWGIVSDMVKRHFIFWGLLFICGLLFCGCSEKARQEQGSSAEKRKGADHSAGKLGKEQGGGASSPSDRPSGGADPTPMPKKADCRVCFIGNSLIQYGNQAHFLEDIALGYGKQITVDQITWGGAYLSDYVDGIYLEKSVVKKRLKRADIVVFQDYGGWQGNRTVKSIKSLQKWCKKNARCFYYMYEDDDMEMEASDYQRLKKLSLKLIPKGQLIDAVGDMFYSYEELHQENDFHPNLFNGYLAALAMHAVIFEKRCQDYPEEHFFEEKEGALETSMKKVREILHGDSRKEKWEEFQQICRKADLLVDRNKILVNAHAMMERSM